MKKYVRPQLLCCNVVAKKPITVSVPVGTTDGYEITDSEDILVKENTKNLYGTDIWDDLW